jgi:hypothetical protein
MKKGLVFFLLSLTSLSSPAGSFRLEGEAFHPATNVDIVWKATNNLPRGLWVYKTIPQNFSTAVVSNLMVIGGFEWKNLVKSPHSSLPDKNLIYFRNGMRYLIIAPTLGWIEYYAAESNDPREPVVDVPDKAKIESLALDVLFQMGIDRSLLCDKKNGYEATEGKLSRDGQMLTTNVFERGVSFGRLIDGIKSRNAGSFMIQFGSHAKIHRFWLQWRNLLPYESCAVAKPDEIMNFIKTGKATLPVQSYDWTGADKATKLTVLEATPYYFDDDIFRPLDFMYPYVDLKVEAELVSSNKTTFYLECPILSTNVAL